MKSRLFIHRNLLTIMFLFIATELFSQERQEWIKIGTWQGREMKYVAGQIAIKVKPAVTKANITPIVQVHGGTFLEEIDVLRWTTISVPKEADIFKIIEQLLQHPLIEAAEPNGVGGLSILPNDPYFRGTTPATYQHQYGLRNTGQSPPGGTSGADIKAEQAWDITTGSSSIKIAILDTGIPMIYGALSHPDLDDPNKITVGFDFVYGNYQPETDPSVRDLYGHGTHVAGIVGAETNNGIGVAGVAWNCKLLIMQMVSFDGFFTSGSIFRNAVRASVDSGAHILNYSGQVVQSSQTDDALDYVSQNKRVFVLSAGNNGTWGVNYPANQSGYYLNIIAVAATQYNDSVAHYSSRGSQLNVSAPGGAHNGDPAYNYWPVDEGDIFSTTPNYSFSMESYGVTQDYGYIPGTSMAAPYVAGTAALILSMNPYLTPLQVRTTLELSADKVPGMDSQDFTEEYGYGRINAYKAVRNLYVPSVYSSLQGAIDTAITGQVIVLEKNSGAHSLTKTSLLKNAIIIEINPGAKLLLNNTDTLIAESGSRIILGKDTSSVGEIEFANNALLDVQGPLVIDGVGNIINANIRWHSDFQVEVNDTLLFKGGGSLRFPKDSTNKFNINISGMLSFEGSATSYFLKDSLGIIYVSLGGTFETKPAVNLEGITNIQALYPSTVKSNCTSQSPCIWQFVHKGYADIYGLLTANNTTFKSGTTQDTLIEWSGIMVGYEDSQVDLDGCTFKDVKVDSFSVSAIHLYESSNANNSIRNCTFERLPDSRRGSGDPKAGNAIFMQPGSSSSTLTATNNTIYKHWHSGVSNVGSLDVLNNNTIYCNVVGTGFYIDAEGLLFNNCIRGHYGDDNYHGEGIYMSESQVFLGNSLAAGYNSITENWYRQINVKNSSELYAGQDGLQPGLIVGGKNEIDITINDNKRVRVDSSSWGVAQYNYWRLIPPNCNGTYGTLSTAQRDTLFEIINPGFLISDSAMCSRDMQIRNCTVEVCTTGTIAPFIVDEPVNEHQREFSLMKSNSVTQSIGDVFEQVRSFRRTRNFSGIYQVIGYLIQQSSQHEQVFMAAKMLLNSEMNHVREYPDSAQRCYSRLVTFLQNRYNGTNNSEIKAALLRLLAQAYYHGGDLASAESKVNQLRSNHASSIHAKWILPLHQIIAMTKRDSALVDSSVNRISRAGLGDEMVRVAQTMRAGFYRSKSKDQISKHFSDYLEQVRYWDEIATQNELLMHTTIRNYPNPFNPSTTIEYFIPKETHVTLKVYSIFGQEIITLEDDMKKKGFHTESFYSDRANPSGVYFYVLTTDYGMKSGRMVVVK